METISDNEDVKSNDDSLNVNLQEDNDTTLRHRKIIDCAKETFETGTVLWKDTYSDLTFCP